MDGLSDGSAGDTSTFDREVVRFDSGDGRRVYRLPLEVFPRFWGNAYLVTGGARPVLVDCGSGAKAACRHLDEGLERVASEHGETVRWADLGALLVTHGHIDHFGGLQHVRERAPRAAVGIHVLDRRVVDDYRMRVALASRHVELFFRSAGVEGERLEKYIASYLRTKALFGGGRVDFTFDPGSTEQTLDVDEPGAFVAVHVPGHCPGQVCLRVGEILLTADHVLPAITPHLSPESITRHTGLGHYLESIDRVEALGGVGVGLGGHGGTIRDVAARCRSIRRHCARRLDDVLEICGEPRTIVEISRRLFGAVRSYHVLLAILEAGAFVEHLDQRSLLRPVEAEHPLRYVRV